MRYLKTFIFFQGVSFVLSRKIVMVILLIFSKIMPIHVTYNLENAPAQVFSLLRHCKLRLLSSEVERCLYCKISLHVIYTTLATCQLDSY